MLLLGARQEVTKKRAQAFPLGTPGIAALQSVSRDRHKNLLCGASSFVITSGRRGKQELWGYTPLGRALMRPRGRRLAKAKAPTAIEKPSGRRGSKGCPLGVFSSPILCDKTKNGHYAVTERAQLVALCEAQGEVVKNLL